MDLRDLLMTPRSKQYVEGLDTGKPEDDFRASMEMRTQADQGKSGQARDLDARDAEHYLFTKAMIEREGPIKGRLMMAGAIPGYSAAKAVAQTFPSTAPALNALLNRSGNNYDLANSSPPDFNELGAGLAALLTPGHSKRQR